MSPKCLGSCHLPPVESAHWTEDSCLPASSHLPPRPPSFPSSLIMGYFWSPYLEIAIVIGLILLAISAPSHFRARNTGTVLLICWAFTGNLVILVNKLIWHDHARNIAPLWCDICESNPFFGCVRAQLVHRVQRLRSSSVSPSPRLPAHLLSIGGCTRFPGFRPSLSPPPR